MSILYKKIIVSFALIALLILFYIIYNSSKSQSIMPQDVKVVETETITKKNLSSVIRLTGKIRARNSTILTAKTSGIFNIIIPAGSKVSKDTVIARIDSNEIEKRYTLCSSAEIIAKEQAQRAKNLFKSGAYSKSDVEKHQHALISAQKDLADAKIAFDKLKFYAPFDGIVGNYKLQDGSQLIGNEAIVNFYDPSNLKLEFDIPVSIISQIENNQHLVIAGKDYQLNYVQKILDDEKHMSPASVNVDCKNCIIGANLDVDLTIKTKESIIVIPTEAFFLRAGQPNVYVVKNDKAELRKIEIGMREKNEIEVITGLEVGEAIVNKNTNRLYPEASVKIFNPKAI